MALAVKVIACSQLTSAVNTDLSAPVVAGKAQIIKSMRFANTNASAAVTLNVYFTRSTGPDRQIGPKNLSIPAGQLYVDETEITLEQGDRIRGSVSFGGAVDYVISGIERDA
jgi:hypothetical protein